MPSPWFAAESDKPGIPMLSGVGPPRQVLVPSSTQPLSLVTLPWPMSVVSVTPVMSAMSHGSFCGLEPLVVGLAVVPAAPLSVNDGLLAWAAPNCVHVVPPSADRYTL